MNYVSPLKSQKEIRPAMSDASSEKKQKKLVSLGKLVIVEIDVIERLFVRLHGLEIDFIA